MRRRGFATDKFIALPAEREEIAEIQAFIDSNPEYWRLGYLEVRRQDGYVLSDRSHLLITMVKPMRGETLVEYLSTVPRDRNASG